MTAFEQWVETYFDRWSASMPDSSISIRYEPKYDNVPPCPAYDTDETTQSGWPWKLISVTAALGASSAAAALFMAWI